MSRDEGPVEVLVIFGGPAGLTAAIYLARYHRTVTVVDAQRRLERDYALTLSPGLRYAFNLPDTQIVVRVSAPVTLARNAKPNYGAILYLSVESKLFQ